MTFSAPLNSKMSMNLNFNKAPETGLLTAINLQRENVRPEKKEKPAQKNDKTVYSLTGQTYFSRQRYQRFPHTTM